MAFNAGNFMRNIGVNPLGRIGMFLNLRTSKPLIKKIDELIIELADRLSEPNKGRFFGSAGPKVDDTCLKGLMRLHDLVQVRAVIQFMTLEYSAPAGLVPAITKIKELFSGIKLDVQPLMSVHEGSQEYDDVKLIATALAAINSIINNPACNGYIRVNNFSTNSTTKGKGALGIKTFLKDANIWLHSNRIDDIIRTMEITTAEEILKIEAEITRLEGMLPLQQRFSLLKGAKTPELLELEGNIASRKAELETLRIRREELSKMPGGTAYRGAAAGGAAAGAGGGSMYGGARRKTRRNRKVRRTTKTKSRRHQ